MHWHVELRLKPTGPNFANNGTPFSKTLPLSTLDITLLIHYILENGVPLLTKLEPVVVGDSIIAGFVI